MAPKTTLDLIKTAPIQRDLPAGAEPLERLANNFLWTWRRDLQEVFEEIDPAAWAKGRDAIAQLSSPKLADALASTSFQAKVRKALDVQDAYLGETSTWFSGQTSVGSVGVQHPIAYFCAEYGLHETYNQYAGGLGILAGDHCKEASDLGLPFVAVGLFYSRGYFLQTVDWSGRQEHVYGEFKPSDCPLSRALAPETGQPLTVSVELPGRTVYAAVWVAPVGRIPVVLLDTDIPENAPEDRKITSQLYTNWREMRLHQEIVLGIGGARALCALGIEPSVWHMNEGHSALLVLERLLQLTSAGKSLAEARKVVAASSVLTIHTPVPEGNERFDANLAKELLGPLLKGSACPVAEVLKLARDPKGDKGIFDLTALGLRHSFAANGVSLLHGRTAHSTWKKLLPFPVTGITNGVHMPTWMGPEMVSLFEGKGAQMTRETKVSVKPSGREGRGRWEAALSLDSNELHAAHRAQKLRLLDFAKQRIFDMSARHGRDPMLLKEILESLNPDAFWIGFSRRFATYKRASLVLGDLRKAKKLLANKERPVQILFSGKAHPADRGGQALIEEVFSATLSREFRGKVFFVENYDMEVGRMLVQGVDLWLNNPRRPLEASGTSGMKAAANGIPNASILDGWWDEAYDSREGCRNGFAIGSERVLKHTDLQDKRDANALYRTLLEEVVPTYFDEKEAWTEVMKNSIASSLYDFSTARMLADYLAQQYSKS